MPAFGVVIGDVVTDFELRLYWLGKESPSSSALKRRHSVWALLLPRQLMLCWSPCCVSKSLKRVAGARPGPGAGYR
jgi:hypothetical protein